MIDALTFESSKIKNFANYGMSINKTYKSLILKVSLEFSSVAQDSQRGLILPSNGCVDLDTLRVTAFTKGILLETSVS